ncbi:hypothetical protein Tco_1457369 [Tanacetum coccineum]
MRIEESLNVKFEESPSPKSSPLVDDDIIEIQIIENQIEDIEIKENEPLNKEMVNIKESKEHLIDSVIGKANEVLVTKGALKSKVGHLDMLDHEVGRLRDEYAWWKRTRRCWNTHVPTKAAMVKNRGTWLDFWPRNGMVVLVSCLQLK